MGFGDFVINNLAGHSNAESIHAQFTYFITLLYKIFDKKQKYVLCRYCANQWAWHRWALSVDQMQLRCSGYPPYKWN